MRSLRFALTFTIEAVLLSLHLQPSTSFHHKHGRSSASSTIPLSPMSSASPPPHQLLTARRIGRNSAGASRRTSSFQHGTAHRVETHAVPVERNPALLASGLTSADVEQLSTGRANEGCSTQRSSWPTLLCRQDEAKNQTSRRLYLRRLLVRSASVAAALTCSAAPGRLPGCGVDVASAAPPMAVMAEELGYFPVTNRNGETIYIPARVNQKSTDQAIELSKYLKSSGAVMYGAFWCPHCKRQRQMFGYEAWQNINYVECASKGEGANPALCSKNGIDGFPMWKFRSGRKDASGEMPLEQLALVSGYKGKFDGSLEPDLPLVGGSCR